MWIALVSPCDRREQNSPSVVVPEKVFPGTHSQTNQAGEIGNIIVFLQKLYSLPIMNKPTKSHTEREREKVRGRGRGSV